MTFIHGTPNSNRLVNGGSSENTTTNSYHQQQQYQYQNHNQYDSNSSGFVSMDYNDGGGRGIGGGGMEYESPSTDEDTIGTQDMTTLSNLTVEGINENLKLRYDGDLVYTYTGTILISVNPYKDLNIYGTPHINMYHYKNSSSSSNPPPPHIYAIAEQAYNSLIRSYDEINDKTQNQSVVISGESGAGKTEATKHILQYLCSVTCNVSTWVENQILEANTILEAFGNAKTIRNDNSSRFGKFMQISFDSRWLIRGCIIQDYLLEQSRITFQSANERNYHVFYQLLSAARKSKQICQQYKLNQFATSNPTYFKYVNNNNSMNIETAQLDLDPLLLALQILQIPVSHVTGLFSTLSAILHLGNLEFATSESDGETAVLTKGDELIIKTISHLLRVNEADFKNVLLTRQINVRGNITEIPLRVNEASENRHAMSKALYSKCFGWLICHINERTNPGMDGNMKVIGLLDIFGFENFEENCNSFEQLCINYANEKLHKFFNQAVFQIEQEIYKSEGLNISEIQFTSNNQILELIEKPPRCILKLLTEQCHLPKGSDLGFLNNLHSEFESHECYEKGERMNWEKRFTIKHYAGKVAYTVNGFVDKNRDVQQDLLFNILGGCDGNDGGEFVRNLAESVFDDGTSATTLPRNTTKGRPTVAETFRGQLQALVEVLGNTKAWYVRCIKPNEHKDPNRYDNALVVEQLKYLGMLEIIRIRKEGYPVHMGFKEFVERFGVCGKGWRGYRGFKDTAGQILETFNPQLPPPPHRTLANATKQTTYLKQSLPPYYYQLGTSKVFLKPQMHELLESLRSAVITTHVIRLQTAYRSYRSRKHFKQLKSACVIIQRAYRGWKGRLLFIKKRRAAITIQCCLRGFFAREVAAALREMRRVEEEIRKREVELSRRKSVAMESDDEGGRVSSLRGGMSSSGEEDERVVGGNKDVSLDNLFEFLLINSRVGNEDDERGVARGNQNKNVCKSNSNSSMSVNDVEFDADESVVGEEDESDMDGLSNNRSGGSTPVVVPPPPSPPPLLPPPENIPVVAKVTNTSVQQQQYARLPEPKEKPPPPPVQFQNSTSNAVLPQQQKLQQQQQIASVNTNNIHHQQQQQRKRISNNGEEPIYESIQPRLPPQQPQQIINLQKLVPPPAPPPPQPQRPPVEEFKPITHPRVMQQQPLPQQPPPPPQPLPSRVEKRVQEIIKQNVQQAPLPEQQTQQPQQPQEQQITTFNQYALQYFSLENRKQTQSQEDYIKEHTNLSKTSHISHPHIHLYDPSNVSVSVFMFRDLNKVMKGELKPETETIALQSMIGYGIEREELRDEIYVQLLRQINGNGNVEWLERLYLVFCLAIVSFPPGKVLSRVIAYELGSISNGNAKLSSQIKWILDNLGDLKVRGCVRRLPPSSVEIQAMKRLGTIVCRFFFLDGRTKAIDIHPTDTAADAIVKLGEKIGVGSPTSLQTNGWAIYQVRPVERVEEHVMATAFIYDVIAGWELGNFDKEKGVSLGCGDNRFVFKKRLWRGNGGGNGGSGGREIPQDPVECSLLYAQAVFGVVKRDDYPVAEKVSLQLAGLQAQVSFSDPPPTQKFDNYTNIESFLPIRIARTRPHASWVPILAQAHRTYGAGKSELVARVWYLSCVMQYPLYGTTMFHVVYKGYWVYGNSLVLGISADGISMIKSEDKFVIGEYAYSSIESVQIEVGEKLVTINLDRSLPPDTHKCFVFESTCVAEIGQLIGSYCGRLANTSSNTSVAIGNRAGGGGNSNKQNNLTNQDRMRLYSNVLGARKALIESGLLRKPEKGLVGVNFLKNTLRRLSKQKIERMRVHAMMMGGGDGSNDGNEYPLEYFCYSKHAMSTSLSVLQAPELESTAIWIFGQLQAYAGFNNSHGNSNTGSPMKTNANANQQSNDSNSAADMAAATILQGVFEKVWRCDQLLNELYVQLIKQTTDHPEPNSRVNSRYWGVLSLVCSVIAPVDVAVRKYLNSHLKRCAITDFVTEEGKFARFAEKCLQHTISSSSVSANSRRQWPPSKNEIVCTVNRKPITARFHFMDGKYHTLQFAPNDTAADLIQSLTSKIGLQSGVKGYAIYEVSTSTLHPQQQQSSPQSNQPTTPWERSLTPHEKPVEVIARWERQKSQQQQTQNPHHHHNNQSPLFKFVIRKHLYDSLDLKNPIEKELVYHQLLSSARNDRFPVNDTEAAMLVALQAQVELGDYGRGGNGGSSASGGNGVGVDEFPDYCAVSAHCLPTRIAASVSHEAVARHHQSLIGSSPEQAKQAVLNLLMSWPLFRCIVFDVTQSFTSNWPRSLWLALDNTGLHLLPQRTRHTLCTFEYASIKSYSPSPTCFMVCTRNNSDGQQNNKVVLSTNQAYQIAQLIKEFVYSNFVRVQQQQQAQGQIQM